MIFSRLLILIALLSLNLFANVLGFSEKNVRFEVSEDSPAHTLIGIVPLESGFEYRIPNANEFLELDVKTGKLFLSSPVDRELFPILSLLVLSSPPSIIHVDVKVVDVNDNDPVFPQPFQNVSLVESAAVGTRIPLQSATDADELENGHIQKYRIENGPESLFKLIYTTSTDENVLFLELLEQVDREEKDFYVFNISARDGGKPPRISFVTVYVDILDANDNAPIFTEKNSEGNWSGDPSEAIVRLTATDSDLGENGRIGYSVEGDESKWFHIDQSGVLRSKENALQCCRNQQPCNECLVTVKASDYGSPPLTSTTTVRVRISRGNRYDPQIHFKLQSADVDFAVVDGTAKKGRTVAVVTVTDEDGPTKGSLVLVAGNEEEAFSFVPTLRFSLLRLNSDVENLKKKEYRLTFEASDGQIPERKSRKELTVYVEKSPVPMHIRSLDDVTVDVSEDVPIGSFVAQLRTGRDGSRFTLENSTNFIIDSENGIITTNRTFDSSDGVRFPLTVHVLLPPPSLRPQKTMVIVNILDTNNHSPSFHNVPNFIEISENSPVGTTIVRVNATDRDPKENGVVHFRISNLDFHKTFRIDSKTGAISLSKQLDFETRKFYEIEVEAYDLGTPSKKNTTNINVIVKDENDHAPFFPWPQYTTSVSRLTRTGADILTITALDLDSGDMGRVQYQLLDSNDVMSIDVDSGTLSINYVPEDDSLTIIVGARDIPGLTSSNNATIFVKFTSDRTIPAFQMRNFTIERDESELDASLGFFKAQNAVKYSSPSPYISIDEVTSETKLKFDQVKGAEKVYFTVVATSVGGLSVSHPVTVIILSTPPPPRFPSRSLRLSLPRDTPTGSELEMVTVSEDIRNDLHYSTDCLLLTIDRRTGVIRLKNWIEEEVDQIQCVITVSDSLNRRDSLKVTVEVERARKPLSLRSDYFFTVEENTPMGKPIANLTDLTEYDFRALDDDGLVGIFPNGMIYVRRPLDRERNSSFSMRITATHRVKGNKFKSNVHISILDVNDNSPKCARTLISHGIPLLELSENEPAGTEIGRVKATDEDEGANGLVTYRILDHHNQIHLDTVTGKITALEPFDAEKEKGNLKIRYEITDQGQPPLTTECEFELRIIDENDNAPVFSKRYFAATVSGVENSTIAQVTASDADSGRDGEVRFILNNFWREFEMDSTSGTISSRIPLHRSFYNVSIAAVDRGEPPLYSHSFLLISVEEDVKTIPIFEYPPDELRIETATAVGSIVGKLRALAGKQRVTIKSGHSSFDVDSRGRVFLIKALKIGKFRAVFKAISHNNVEASISIPIVVDDSIKSFRITDTHLTVQENNTADQVIGTLETSLPSKGFEILFVVPDTSVFSISGSQLISSKSLDRERNSQYHIMVHSTSESDNLTSNQLITVDVLDVNDNDPVCLGQHAYSIEKLPATVRIYCEDDDSEENGTLHYFIDEIPGILVQQDGSVVITDLPNGLLELPVKVNDMDLSNPRSTVTQLELIRVPLDSSITFTSETITMLLPASTPIGHTAGRISASSSSPVEYFITSSSEKFYFEIDRVTGELKVLHSFASVISKAIDITVSAVTKTSRNDVRISIEIIADILNPIRTEYILNVNDTSPEGSFIGFIEDRDVVFSCSHPIFSVHSKSGEITLKRTLTREAHDPFYKLAVQISRGSVSARVIVYIIVNDTKERGGQPGFPDGFLDFFVEENAPFGTVVGRASANGRGFRYSLSPDVGLSVDEKSGIVRTTRVFDREKKPLHNLTLHAISPRGTFSKNATLFVDDQNDNSPVFSQDEITIRVAENVKVGQTIVELKWDDADSENFFNFEILNDDFDQFQVNHKGHLIVTSPLDRESKRNHQLRIRLNDDIAPWRVNNAHCTVNVIVDDINDNSPVFRSSEKFLVAENAAIGTVVGTVSATDADSGVNGRITYRILPSSLPRAPFVIDPILGYLIVNKDMRTSPDSEYIFNVSASDGGDPPLTSHQKIVVQVMRLNDEIPMLREQEKEVKISESAERGTFVHQFKLDNLVDECCLFTIDPSSSEFAIDALNGRLTVAGHLNYENQKEHTVTVFVKNLSGGSSTNGTLVVRLSDENDEIPHFVDGSPVHFSVAENIDGPYPVVIGSTIAEDDEEGANGLIAYSILLGNTTLFMVNTTTGQLKSLLPLDRETESEHILRIQATDSGFPRQTSTSDVIIKILDVNDNVPMFSQPYYKGRVTENGSSGERILQVHADDRDDGDNGDVRYHILNGASVPFSIEKSSGWITTTKSLDREEKGEFAFIVRAEDNGRLIKLSSDVNVTIVVDDVNDNNPVINNQQLDVYVRNDLKKGDVVYVVDGHDDDLSEELFYNISGQDAQFFKISQSGMIYARTDLSVKSHYSLVVSVFDRDGLNTSASFSFYTESADRFPTFVPLAKDVVKMKENHVGKILKFSAGTSKSLPTGRIQFSIVAGNGNRNFAIDSTGILRIVRPLDHESRKSHRVTVMASDSDSPPLSSIQSIDIVVEDENDNAPVFAKLIYSASILENSDASVLLAVAATDLDTSNNSLIRYSIIGGNTGDAFEVDPSNGLVSSLKSLDREEISSYELLLEARDSGSPSLASTAILKVSVLDEDDNPPRFTRLFHASVPENAHIGTKILRIESQDPDGPTNHTYSFDDVTIGNMPIPFWIDPQEGDVYLDKELDRETNSSYRLRVRVEDGFWSVHTSVTIDVEDVNDNAPQFTQDVYVFLVDPAKKAIGSVQAVDHDSGENSRVVYSLNCTTHSVRIDPNSGTLSWVNGVSSEDPTECSVIARDHGVPAAFSSARILIIQNIEEEVLVSAPQNGNETILIKAFGRETPMSFELLERVPLDLTSDGNLSILPNNLTVGETVECTILKTTESRVSAINLRILIVGPNEYSPQFDENKYSFKVSRGAPVGTVVGMVSAHDDDVHLRAHLAFDLSDSSLFRITSTGAIVVSDDLAIYPRNLIHIAGIVSDAGFPQKNGTAKIIIEMVDEMRTPAVPVPLTFESVNGTFIGCLNLEENSYPSLFDCPSITVTSDGCLHLKHTSSKYIQCTVSIQDQGELKLLPVTVKTPSHLKQLILDPITVSVSARSLRGGILHRILRDDVIFGDDSDILRIEGNGDIVRGKSRGGMGNVTTTAYEMEDRLMTRIPIVFTAVDDAPPPVFPSSHSTFNVSSDLTLPYLLADWKMITPIDWHLDIVGGNSEQSFCISDRGELSICGEIEADRRYHIQMVVASKDRVASRCSADVYVLPVSQIVPRISPMNGFIRENSPSQSIVRLEANVENASMRISDEEMRKIFSLSSSFVLSSLVPLNRSISSVYKVAISVTSSSRTVTNVVHVYVDDEVDVRDEEDHKDIKIEIVTRGKEPATIHSAFPRSNDISRSFHCSEVDNLITASCDIVDYSNDSLSMEARDLITRNVIRYTAFMRKEEQEKRFISSSVLIEMFGMEDRVADFFTDFQDSYPDMKLHLLSSNHSNVNFYRIHIVMGDRNLNIITSKEAADVINSFLSKRKGTVDVDVVNVVSDICGSFGKCVNGGNCTLQLTDAPGYSNLRGNQKIFVTPSGDVNPICRCPSPFSGRFCNRRALCSSSSKDSLSYCVHGECQGGICKCRGGYEGERCEMDVDECLKNPCSSSETCLNLPGSFKCLCRNGLEECESDFLARDQGSSSANSSFGESTVKEGDQPCNETSCIHGRCASPTYCECVEGFSGRECTIRIFGFQRGSNMNYANYDRVRTIAFELRTLSTYSHILTAKPSSKLDRRRSISIANGKLQINGVGLNLPPINDGQWRRIRIDLDNRLIAMDMCQELGGCQRCNDSSCVQKLPQSLTFGNNLNFGTVNDKMMVTQTPHYTGCLREIIVNNEKLNLFKEERVLKSCPKGEACMGKEHKCYDGACVDDFEDTKCICREGFEAKNCREAISPVSLSDSSITLSPSEWIKTELEKTEDITETMQNTSEENCDDISSGSQWIELDYRSNSHNSTILTFDYNKRYVTIQIRDAHLVYGLWEKDRPKVEISIEKPPDDGNWHRITLELSADRKTILFQVDGRGKEAKSLVSLPPLLSRRLRHLTVGGISAVGGPSFDGCIRRLIINNQAQNLQSHGDSVRQQFFDTTTSGEITEGCSVQQMSASWQGTAMAAGFASLFVIFIVFGLFIGVKLCRNARKWKGKSQPWRGVTSPGWQPAKEIDAFKASPNYDGPLNGFLQPNGGHINVAMSGRETPESHTYERALEVDQVYEMPDAQSIANRNSVLLRGSDVIGCTRDKDFDYHNSSTLAKVPMHSSRFRRGTSSGDDDSFSSTSSRGSDSAPPPLPTPFGAAYF